MTEMKSSSVTGRFVKPKDYEGSLEEAMLKADADNKNPFEIKEDVDPDAEAKSRRN